MGVLSFSFNSYRALQLKSTYMDLFCFLSSFFLTQHLKWPFLYFPFSIQKLKAHNIKANFGTKQALYKVSPQCKICWTYITTFPVLIFCFVLHFDGLIVIVGLGWSQHHFFLFGLIPHITLRIDTAHLLNIRIHFKGSCHEDVKIKMNINIHSE